MRCHCNRIARLRRDIDKIIRTRNDLQVLRLNNGALDSGLSELGGSMRVLATPDNIDSCATSISNANSGAQASIEAMIGQCTSRVSMLQSDLSRLESEDRAHHQARDA